MKKALTAVLIVLLALFIVSCDNSGKEPFSPEWARGEWSGNIIIGEGILNITDSSFSINGANGLVSIAYPSEGVTLKKSSFEGDNKWILELDGISLLGVTVDKITIEKGEEKTLNVTLPIDGTNMALNFKKVES